MKLTTQVLEGCCRRWKFVTLFGQEFFFHFFILFIYLLFAVLFRFIFLVFFLPSNRVGQDRSASSGAHFVLSLMPNIHLKNTSTTLDKYVVDKQFQHFENIFFGIGRI